MIEISAQVEGEGTESSIVGCDLSSSSPAEQSGGGRGGRKRGGEPRSGWGTCCGCVCRRSLPAQRRLRRRGSSSSTRTTCSPAPPSPARWRTLRKLLKNIMWT